MKEEAERSRFGLFKKKSSDTHTEIHSKDQLAEKDELLRKAQSFNNLTVADVMVPRADIIAVEKSSSLYKIIQTFKTASHSRLPIYDETLDNPIGMVHIKDILAVCVEDILPYHLGNKHSLSKTNNQNSLTKTHSNLLEKINRPLLYIPSSMRALDLLIRMKARRIHMALVVDEFGGTDGLVTLEDLVEQIVGNIEDEHDKNSDAELYLIGSHLWYAEARVLIEDFEQKTKFLLNLKEDEDIDTLGGIIASLTRRVPERGEIITHPSGCEFEIIESDSRRIKRIHIHLPKSFPKKISDRVHTNKEVTIKVKKTNPK